MKLLRSFPRSSVGTPPSTLRVPRSLKVLSISLLALALTACAVGPDYQAPAIAPAQLI